VGWVTEKNQLVLDRDDNGNKVAKQRGAGQGKEKVRRDWLRSGHNIAKTLL